MSIATSRAAEPPPANASTPASAPLLAAQKRLLGNYRQRAVRPRPRQGLRALRHGGAPVPRHVRRGRRGFARARAPAARRDHLRAGGPPDARLQLLLQRGEPPPRRGALREDRLRPRLLLQLRAPRRTRRCSSSRAGTSSAEGRGGALPVHRVRQRVPRPHHGRGRADRARPSTARASARSLDGHHARRLRRRCGAVRAADGPRRRGDPRGAGAGRRRRAARAGRLPRRAAALADEHGALLLVDEVQTGIGRTGRWLGAAHDGVQGDAARAREGARRRLPDRRAGAARAPRGRAAPGHARLDVRRQRGSRPRRRAR